MEEERETKLHAHARITFQGKEHIEGMSMSVDISEEGEIDLTAVGVLFAEKLLGTTCSNVKLAVDVWEEFVLSRDLLKRPAPEGVMKAFRKKTTVED